jgi:glycosyltransferase involved in cell wall biosynthesis
VTWFADEVFPIVLRLRPACRFWIVGSKPVRSVRELGERPNVTVTGRVEDVRPYLKHASVAVAPLRIARGIQNKVLEALAMARPVVCTPAAAEGIAPAGGAISAIEDEPQRFASATLAAMQVGDRKSARETALARFSWDSHLRVVDALIAATPSGH